MNILAIDLGGTSAKVALIKDEQIIKRWNILTKVGDIFQNIKDNLEGLDLEKVDRIGLSMPGFIDHKTGIVTLSGNLKLNDFDTKKEFKKIFGKDVYVVNDANAAALGEYWKGLDKQYSSIILYTIGTGIGGGLILDDKLISGAHGFAGEFGHAGVMQNKFECACGLKNCVEPLSSATGIEKLLTEHFKEKTTIKDVSSKIIQKDPKVTQILRDALKPLCNHIAIMQTAVNPEAVIIGGGPSVLGQALIDIIEENLKEIQLPFILEKTKILIAKTKNDAGIYGAAIWAIQKGN
ncbi:ROK family protein [Mycoplasma marinum]|uniref:Glucose kinase n=1 Tax=Mycoplasma marinum TaxID=1937190 RepID=A0A4R0XSF5_9MOLU|nr:ROK family protein [Mycoplasma marinum]TCG11360.1 glucose kinase [Mycoplasma marinum]